MLLSLFFIQQFYVAGVMVWFYANRSYIERQLCINKNKPQSDCRGKCVLTKKLKDAEQKQQQQLPVQEKQIKETVPCIVETPVFHVKYITQQAFFNPAVSANYSYLFNDEIFRPPCAC